jgi:putative ABC transport system permease protein
MIQNFLFVLNRFKTSSILNLLGLSLAFAAFTVILIQVNFEYGFDKCHPDADDIYRVDMTEGNSGEAWSIHARPLTEAIIRSSPHIVAGTLINPFINESYIKVEGNTGQEGFKESFITCHPHITRVFGFRMMEGTTDCLENPQNVIIPQSMALKIFGNAPSVGKQITLTGYLWSKQNKGNLTIGGVYEDFPGNTQLKNSIYTAIDNTQADDWNSQNYFLYIKLDKHTRPEIIADDFNRNFDFSVLNRENSRLGIRLVPIRSIYFMNEDPGGNLVRSGNRNFPLILLSISILIIVIAIINYTNFNMALAPMRLRSINTRKILGSSDAALRGELLGEGVMMSLTAWVLSVFLLFGLHYHGNILPFIKADIDPGKNEGILAIVALVAVLTGIIAALRPAFYTTSVPPVMALKGRSGLSPAGRKWRSALIGFQFFISIVLIIIAFFMYKQNSFLQHYRLGYDKEHIVLAELSQDIASNKQTLVAKLKENPDIEAVAFSMQKFGSSDVYRTWSMECNGKQLQFYSLGVSWNFPEVMGISVIEGKMPGESDEGGEHLSFIINKTAQEAGDVKPGDQMKIGWMDESYTVIGIVDNIKFRSLRNRVDNMVFVFNESRQAQPFSYIRLRAGADIRQSLRHIEKSVRDLDPTYPVKVEFYDDIFNALYGNELNVEKTISLFSLLAIIISIAGVFGLVMFECEFKRKEISIRKIAGSTEGEVVALFTKNYLAIFVVGFLSAVPVGYIVLHRWLENFAYKTSLNAWGFLLAGGTVLVVILLTVGIQSYKAAMENPVKALKIE